jgi:hypothetical protein
MKGRPILFSAPMVRALLDGAKTQTRRVVKPHPYLDEMGNACWNGSNFGQNGNGVPHFKQLASPIPSSKTGRVHCPYGKPGDRLWVRETFCVEPDGLGEVRVIYAAGGEETIQFPPSDARTAHADRLWTDPEIWRPSIHMPRWASRITLEITGVRVERLQDISRADSIAEGVDWAKCPAHQTIESIEAQRQANAIGMCAHHVAEIDYIGGYRRLWESINGPDSWAANPWVWVVEFKKVTS